MSARAANSNTTFFFTMGKPACVQESKGGAVGASIGSDKAADAEVV
jgi:hypothetical protein